MWLARSRNATSTSESLPLKPETCGQVSKIGSYLTPAQKLTVYQECIQADMSKLGECEFWLISELNAQLIVHHPYQELSNLKDSLALTNDELALAWSVINDHYVTVMLLQKPPRIVALAALVLVAVVRPSQNAGSEGSRTSRGEQVMRWIGKGDVDIEAIAESVQELISMYATLDQYNEKVCKEQLLKLARARGLN